MRYLTKPKDDSSNVITFKYHLEQDPTNFLINCKYLVKNLASKIPAPVQSAYTRYINSNCSNTTFIAPVDEQEAAS